MLMDNAGYRREAANGLPHACEAFARFGSLSGSEAARLSSGKVPRHELADPIDRKLTDTREHFPQVRTLRTRRLPVRARTPRPRRCSSFAG
jgi:hypothetical protein